MYTRRLSAWVKKRLHSLLTANVVKNINSIDPSIPTLVRLTMTFIDVPTQPLLEIPAKLHSAAWQNRSASAAAWWNTYLNQVCLQTVLPWLQAEYSPLAQRDWNQNALEQSWQLVNGTALTLASHRIILIPQKTIDTQEFRVPQEWIDLPNWAGDYYLAIQVNPDDASILIWGYTTHAQLKTKGHYDASDRTYTLEAYDLIQDFAVFGVTQTACPHETTRSDIASLPRVPASQAQHLLQRLASPAILQPRLEIPFQLWGALLEDAQWRQQLGQRRLGQAPNMVFAQSRSALCPSEFTPLVLITRLGQWAENAVDEGWQTLDAVLGNQPALAYQLRNTAELSIPATQRIKVLELAEQTLWLCVGLEPESGERLRVRVQLRSAEADAILPSGATITLLSNSGDVVQSIAARDRDNGIQLKRFRCSMGTQFSLQISLESIDLTEDFTV